MTDAIIKSILDTTKELNEKEFHLPDKQGIYAFIDKSIDLGRFGGPGRIIYVGLAEKSLSSRDVDMHLAVGQTGWSTLRRSIGAILKVKLNLTACMRDQNPKKLRPDKFKFDDEGEKRLTDWMMANLKIGAWFTHQSLSLEALRKEEEKVILKLKPTLDLDRRTKRFNPLSVELDELRKICRDEVKMYIDDRK